MAESLTLPILLVILGASLGFALYKIFIARLLPQMELKEAERQRKSMLEEANRQKDSILKRQRAIKEENLKILEEEVNEDIAHKKHELEIKNKELEEEREFTDLYQAEIKQKEQQISSYKQELENTKEEISQAKELHKNSTEEITKELSRTCEVNTSQVIRQKSQDLLSKKQIDLQKSEKQQLETLNLKLSRKAKTNLSRVLSRYSPNFYWPKPINLVEVKHKNHLEKLHSGNDDLLDRLKDISGVDINLVDEKEDKEANSIKVIGGFGIAKEASRLTLEKVLSDSDFSAWKRAQSIYKQNFQRLSHEASKLGAEAVRRLHLEGIHPEIQKLVGALNWRTSYRQNQWHHTVEVATLAGILAHELGEDPDAAKRTGLLHDIGKALDYGIDASHAIISADYADRYGENRLVCDVVLSHHADLLVETPLAYILQTADTLSGARPGARVNLEEGYQIRLGAIQDAVYSFEGIADLAIMNGGREVHVQVFHEKVPTKRLGGLAQDIAQRIEESVNYPGQIKVIVTRTIEATKVA